MAQTKTDRLAGLGMPVQLAKEVTDQIAESGGGGDAVSWGDIQGKPATFPPVIGTTATTALAGNTPLLQIGTTATTAKAGNYTPAWGDVTGKPAVIAAGADAAAARTAIGAGTSNLAIGTTAATAKAGNWVPPAGVAVADAVDETDVVAQFNELLASLRTAGFINA